MANEKLEKYRKAKENGTLVCVKDTEGYVSMIDKNDLTDEYIIITREELEELNGTKYYRETFGHGGARKGSGRKGKGDAAAKSYTIRLTNSEREEFTRRGGAKWLREQLKKTG